MTAPTDNLRAKCETLLRESTSDDPDVVVRAAQVLALLDEVTTLRASAERLDGQLSRVLHEMAGSVSLCWEPKPTGEFESTKALEFVAKAVQELRSMARSDGD